MDIIMEFVQVLSIDRFLVKFAFVLFIIRKTASADSGRAGVHAVGQILGIYRV